MILSLAVVNDGGENGCGSERGSWGEEWEL